MTIDWRFRPLMIVCVSVCLHVVRAPVSPVSAKLWRPHDDATVKCSSTSASEVVSAWYRNLSDGKYSELSQEDSTKYVIANDSLTVFKVGENDVGTYLCQVLDRNYSVDISMVPVVSRMDKSMNLIEGDRLELECSSWGWPVPNITWWRRDPLSGVESDPTLNTIISYSKTVTGARLTIEQVALSDYSKYVCVAANTVGSTNATTLVRVKGWLAPLWPFIGICIEILILIVIIAIYERRRSRQLAEETRKEEAQRLMNSADHKGKDDVRQRKS